MKKIALIALIISSLSLVGCSINENIDNDVLIENSGNSNLSENISDNNSQEDVVDNEDEIINDGSEEAIKKQLIDNNNWSAREVWNSNGEAIGLSTYYGSGVIYSNEGFVFKEDGTFSCFVGVWGESDADFRGTYTIDAKNKEISFRYNSGNISVAKYRLSQNNTILDLTEEKEDYNGEKVKILFAPIEDESEN